MASGIAPYRTPGLAAMTDQPRYRELARRYGPLAAGGASAAATCASGFLPRPRVVQVLARLRPWLALLLAITVNSPIAGGRDTGWANRRHRAWSRWPTAVAPAVWPDATGGR